MKLKNNREDKNHILYNIFSFTIIVGIIFFIISALYSIFIGDFLLKIAPYFYIILIFIFFVTFPYDDNIFDSPIEIRKKQSNSKKRPFYFPLYSAFFLSTIDMNGIPILSKLKELVFSPGKDFKLVTTAIDYSYKPGQFGTHYDQSFINKYTGELIEFNIFINIIFQFFFYLIISLILYFLAFIVRKYILNRFLKIPTSNHPRETIISLKDYKRALEKERDKGE